MSNKINGNRRVLIIWFDITRLTNPRNWVYFGASQFTITPTDTIDEVLDKVAEKAYQLNPISNTNQ